MAAMRKINDALSQLVIALKQRLEEYFNLLIERCHDLQASSRKDKDDDDSPAGGMGGSSMGAAVPVQ